MNLVFDIETDGLLPQVTQIHCIGIHDLDTGKTEVFNDKGNDQPITKGIQMLEDADTLIGHNVIGYDIPVIKKLFTWFKPTGEVLDTLLLSRLYTPDLLKVDSKLDASGKRSCRWETMPLQLMGRHSLEAYGHRLGEFKGSFGKDTDWKEWSPEMQDYMIQDVHVTTKLWKHFYKKYLTG